MDIRILNNQDIFLFRQLLDIFQEVFEHTQPLPPDAHLNSLLNNPQLHVFVIELQGRVAGGLTLYTLPSYYHVPPMAYIYDVGIAPHAQRRGLGKALLKAVTDFCRTHQYELAYVTAESEDTAAVDFYRQTGCSSELNAIQFTYAFTHADTLRALS